MNKVVYSVVLFSCIDFLCTSVLIAEKIRYESTKIVSKDESTTLLSGVYAYTTPDNLPQGSPWFIAEKYNSVWMTGDSALIAKTQPGNLTQWTLMNAGIPSNVQINYLEFIDAQRIFAAGGNGTIYKSTDGGMTWNISFSDTSITDFINNVRFFDANHGVAYGDGSNTKLMALLETTDGGNTWKNNNTYLIGAGNYNLMRFVPPSFALLVGYNVVGNSTFRGVWRSTDLGKAWSFSIIGTGTSKDSVTSTFGIDFKDDNSGIACRRDSTFWYTTDAGLTWTQIGQQTEMFYYCSDFVEGTSNAVCGGRRLGALAEIDLNTKTYVVQKQDTSYSNVGFTWVNFHNLTTGYMISGGKPRTFYSTQTPTEVRINVNTVPQYFSLSQNYPNPFNPSTIIEYGLPKNSRVKIIVFDMLGREVQTLVDEERSSGNYKIEFNANRLSGGVYFYQLQTSEFTQTKKFILMK